MHLHIGVSINALELAEMVAEPLVGRDKTFAESDSWEEWGERAGAGVSRHVILEAPDIEQARKAAGVMEGTGILKTSKDRFKTRWAITTKADWSQVLETDADTTTDPQDRAAGAEAKEAYIEAKASALGSKSYGSRGTL